MLILPLQDIYTNPVDSRPYLVSNLKSIRIYSVISVKTSTLIKAVATCITLWAASTAQAVYLIVDDFSDGTTSISSTGPLVSEHDSGLDGVLGGSRYSYVDRTSAGGTVSVGVNSFPFLGFTFFTSSGTARGEGGLSYGRFSPLGLDLLTSGFYTGFRLEEFAADAPGLTGNIRLTLHTSGGTNAIAYSIANFINNPEWKLSDFSGVNLANVNRIDLDWYGFSDVGADLEFTIFGFATIIPEPGTFVLLVMGGLILRTTRKKFINS